MKWSSANTEQGKVVLSCIEIGSRVRLNDEAEARSIVSWIAEDICLFCDGKRRYIL